MITLQDTSEFPKPKLLFRKERVFVNAAGRQFILIVYIFLVLSLVFGLPIFPLLGAYEVL